MGKIVTIYLTDEEAKSLTRFCEENSCSQYSAIKTGLRDLLNRPVTKEATPAQEQRNDASSRDESLKNTRSHDSTSFNLRQLLRNALRM